MKSFLGITAISLLVFHCGARQQPEIATQMRVSVPTHTLTADLTQKLDFHPDHGFHKNKIVGYVDVESWNILSQAEKNLFTAAPEAPVTDSMYEGYHNYTSLTEELKRLSTAYPNFIRLETAGKSVHGRELWYVVVSRDVQVDHHKPKFIYHANMHGDEVVGRELMIYLVRHLMEQYGKDPKVTQIVDHAELFVMPSMNPDGFELGTRGNAYGIDLNRQFPDRFTSPQDEPGSRPVEVRHMMNLAAKHHFVYGINWHGGEICFNLPWGNIANSKPEKRFGDDLMFYPIGREYTELNPSMHKNHEANFDHGLTYGYEWYPVNGGINDWFNHYRRSVHGVVELTVTKWPDAKMLPIHWEDNRDAMLTHLRWGLRGVHLDIRSPTGESVKSPTIHLASAPQRSMTFDDGFVHRLTGDGNQVVTIEAPGFKSQTIEIPPQFFDGHWTRVELAR